MPLVYFLVVAALIYSAHKATRVKGLLNAALWLAGTSCLTSILVYILGSPGLAVIELSVGAGLVTVLFVFAISIIGDEKLHRIFCSSLVSDIHISCIIWHAGLFFDCSAYAFCPIGNDLTDFFRSFLGRQKNRYLSAGRFVHLRYTRNLVADCSCGFQKN